MRITSVAAENVVPGDYIFVSCRGRDKRQPFERWSRVLSVEEKSSVVRMEHGTEREVRAVKIITGAFHTVKSRGEGVTVRRGAVHPTEGRS